MTTILRAHAENQYAEELTALKEADRRPRRSGLPAARPARR